MTRFGMDEDGWYRYGAGGKFKLEVDFGDGYVNLTDYVTGIHRESGRRGPLDRFNASTLLVELDNRDREFSPWRAGSLGQGNRNLPIRWWASTAEALERPRFTGWTSRWEEVAGYTAQGGCVSRVRVQCHDGFKRLARANTGLATSPPVGNGELSGARVHRVLDAAGWDEDLRYVDDGEVTLQATDLSSPALDEINLVALAEAGLFFISADGVATFYDRASVDASIEPQAYFGSVVRLGELTMASDDVALYNTIRVARSGGTTYAAVDAPSVALDGQILWARTDLPLETNAQAEALAPVLLARAVNSAFSIGPFRVNPITGGADAWEAVVLVGVTNPVIVVHADTTAGAGYSALARIDGITDDVGPGRWTTTYTHSPIDAPTEYTVIGPPTDLAATVTGNTITWTWNIPVHGYDQVFVRVDGGDWMEIGNTTETFTVSGLEPGSSHTLCVRGRLTAVDTDSVCLTATTLTFPGPPDPDNPDGGTDIPDPPAECEAPKGWVWRVDELIASVWTLVDEGLWVYGLDPAEDWRPDTITWVPGTWYRITYQLYCDGAPEGDPIEWDWVEPVDWEDPCDWADPPIDPLPEFMIELCAPTRLFREIITDSAFHQGPLFEGPVPGPAGGTDVAALAGAGTDPGKIASGTLDVIGDMGLKSPIPIIGPPPEITVGYFVRGTAEPAYGFAAVRVGRVGIHQGAWTLARYATASTNEVRYGLTVVGEGGVYDVDFDAAGTDDQQPVDGDWHSVCVTWGGPDQETILYLDGLPVATVDLTTLNPDWEVVSHDHVLEWWGEPGSEVAHLMGWDEILTAEQVEEIFGIAPPPPELTYDEEVLADNPKAYWPLDSIDTVELSAYDTVVLADGPKAYWPLNDKDTIILPSYDVSVLADSPKAYWKLNQIDTV